MSEMFEEFKKQLKYENGVITYHGKRVFIGFIDWLAGLQVKLEEIMGSSGTYVLINNASYVSGKNLLPIMEKIIKPDDNLETKINKILKSIEIRGIGQFTLEKVETNPVNIVIKYEHSYVEGHYKNESECKCFYVVGIFPMIEKVLGDGGIKEELDFVEEKCVSKGDPYCEFIIKKKE